MKIVPLHDYVLIRRFEAESKSAKGILLPDTAKEKPMRGEVLAVGPGRTTEDGVHHKVEVHAGQVVLFQRYSGSEVPEDCGKDLLITQEANILGTIEG